MIASPLLTHRCGYADGRWVAAGSGRTLTVLNPADGEGLADVPNMAAFETNEAIASAARAAVSPAPLDLRRQWLDGLAARLVDHREELARIITLENGKPLREAAAEVDYAAGFFRFFATQLGQLEPRELAQRPRGCRWTVHPLPVGVAGLITPWNFPLAMLAKKVAAALGAGCSLVLKPAELTPLTAIACWHLLDALPLPPGQANLVIGAPEAIGQTLCAHPDVRLLSFTGSTRVGRLLLAQAAPHLKRVALELGGNAPLLVFADADLDAAADALIANKFRAAGQTCVCTNRVLVEERVAAPFADRVVERVARLRVGPGLDPASDLGPLIHRDAFDRVAGFVADALRRGARRLLGNDPPRPAHAWGAFYPPTVLAEVTPDMQVCQEEIFGPVVALGTFRSEDEAIAVANGTGYGLAAYAFTQDADRAGRLALALACGHLGLNTGQGPTPEAPFGGVRRSGFGREGGLEGLLEFTDPRTVATPAG